MKKEPIKRNKHIVQLSKDHHFTLLFCWKIKTGVKLQIETGRIKNYISYFWQTHMQPHFKEEETLLFVQVKGDAVQKALNEHAEIKSQIDTLLNSEKINDADLLKLSDSVEAHVRYEERELFPHLEKILSETQLQQIGDALKRNHAVACSDEFGDEFWIRAKQKCE